MNIGWKQTFEFLAHTENDAAVAVLAPALDSAQEAIQVAALEALLERKNPDGLLEILRRLNQIRPAWRNVLAEKSGRLGSTFRDAVLGKERRLAAYACEAICQFHEFDLMPSLLTALEADGNDFASLMGTTVIRLAEALSLELDQTPDRRRRDPQFVRRSLVAALEKSLERFSQHGRKETIEAFLMLASRENATLKQILLDPGHPCYADVLRVLQSSERAGVFRLLLSFIGDPHAPLAALQVVTHRVDLEFVSALLTKAAEDHRSVAVYNLKRLENVAWAMPEHLAMLGELSEDLQASAVRFIGGSSMSRSKSLAAMRFLAEHGSVPARRAAMEALAEYPGSGATEAVVKGLDDPDPCVVAHAARQLRGRGIPHSFSRLIGLADHPHDAVRQAVRESLTEFSFEKYLANFDLLEPEVRRGTGELVFKIDTTAPTLLRAEMASPTRTRRLRAISMTVAMGAVEAMEANLIEMLEDDDHMVRLEAVDVLATRGSPTARQALERALTDPSASVQQAASRGLRSQERLYSQ